MIKSGRFYEQLKEAGLSRSDAADLLSYCAGISYTEALINPYNHDIDKQIVDDVLKSILDDVPVAYITGRKEFYGYEYSVSPATLIPRCDTEVLVESVLRDFAGADEDIFITDLYTGSACILLSILKNLPKAKGCGVDISVDALSVARRNSEQLGLEDRACFIQQDVLSDFSLSDMPGKIHILTANPPYVTQEEYDASARSLSYEPRLALLADDNGYLHYKKLLNTLAKTGNNNVHFYFEVGHTQAGGVQEYASKLGITTHTVKDLAGIERVVAGIA